jgi:predicted DNA-binding transcriptional regulator AlpA
MRVSNQPREALPFRLQPRGLSRVEAAAYVGVSPTLFDRTVKDRLMPKPLRLYGRVIWDRLQLDEAIELLRDGADEGGEHDQWSIRP